MRDITKFHAQSFYDDAFSEGFEEGVIKGREDIRQEFIARLDCIDNKLETLFELMVEDNRIYIVEASNEEIDYYGEDI